MSTEVQPPSPHLALHNAFSPSPPRPNRQRTAPPTSFPTRAHRRTHGRSSSFTGFVSRILPSHRPEKGYTLRERWDRTSTVSAADLVFGLPVEGDIGNAKLGKGIKGLIERRGVAVEEGVERMEVEETAVVNISGRNGKGSRFREEWGDGKVEAGGSLGRGERKREDGKRLSWLFGGKRKGKEVDGIEAANRSPERVERPQSQPSLGLSARFQSTEENEPQNTEIKQTFEDKKSRRGQKRSLLESGDFLGVQGANPRTGTWDISDATSSSHPSATSEETKRKLEQHARNLEEKKKKYEEAQATQQVDLQRVQSLRENRRKERAEQRKQDMMERARRYGKWRLNDTGWSSVAEPELSPIEQSAAGSPVRETPAADRLFPMPSALDPTPYVDTSHIEQHDYFGRRKISSPLLHDRLAQDVGRPPVVSQSMSIRRKAVGSSSRARRDESSATVIHSNNLPSSETHQLQARVVQTTDDTLQSDAVDWVAPVQNAHSVTIASHEPSIPFLDPQELQSDPGGRSESKATATSFPSASTSQGENRLRLVQSLRATNQEKRPLRLDVLPPVAMKSPMQARVPSNSLSMKGPPMVVWAPPTITENIPESPAAITTIPTITTTGSARLRPLPAQFDGPSDSKNDKKVSQSPFRGPLRIPQRISSRKKKTQNEPLKNKAQSPRADVGMSSAVTLTLTKQRINRSFLVGSPGGGSPTLRNTPISTFIYPQKPVKQKLAAENAARLAFERLNFQMGAKNRVPQSLLPVLRRQKGESMKEYIEREFKTTAGGRGDIGLHSRNNQIVRGGGLPQKRSLTTPRLLGATTKKGGDDSLVVWHPKPQLNNAEAGKQRGEKPKAGQGPRPGPPLKKKIPTVREIAISIFQTAWWFVEPVFDPKSEVRKRCDQRRLTWRDVCLFAMATVLVMALFLIVLAFVRMLGMVLTFAKGFLSFLKLWSGL